MPSDPYADTTAFQAPLLHHDNANNQFHTPRHGTRHLINIKQSDADPTHVNAVIT